MLFQLFFNKLSIAGIAIGISLGTIAPALSQGFGGGFYFPSASFFTPLAAGLESDGEEYIDLNILLAQYPHFQSRWQQAQLGESLKQQKFLTVLMPSEEAFAALSPAMQQKLSEPENLKKLMQYHAIAGKIGKQDIQRRAVATLLDRHSVQIKGVPQGDQIGVMLNQANAGEPLAAVDGVVIPIDDVLIPPELAESIEN